MLGFNGGLLGARRVPAVTAASGLWVQNEQSLAKSANIWPSSPGATVTARYFRLNNFSSEALQDNTFDVGEIQLFLADTLYTGITATTNFSFYQGSASVMTDGVTSESSRAFVYQSWPSIRATAQITLDMGSAKAVSHIKVWRLYNAGRFPDAFDFSSSNDNVTYTLASRISLGTISGSYPVFYSDKKPIF